MGKINKDSKHFYRNTILGSVLLVISVSLIIFTMPRSGKQDFSCTIGQPWNKGDLTAKFDCPVYKAPDSIKHEEALVTKNFKPYYTIDRKIGTDQLNAFYKMKNDTASGVSKIDYRYRGKVSKCLKELYNSGIMSVKDYNELQSRGTESIRIIEGKHIDKRALQNVYSTSTAYEELISNPELEDIQNELRQCDMNAYIMPNLTYEKDKSEDELNTEKSAIGKSLATIVTGQKIIDRGDMVTPETKQIIDSYAIEYDKRITDNNKDQNMLVGHVIFVCVLMLLFGFYMVLYRGDYMEEIRSFLLMVGLVTIFPILTSLAIRFGTLSVYVIPYCILPIFLRIFLDSRTAFTAHTISILICCVIVQYQYEFVIIQLIAGLVAIYSLREMSRRSQVLKTALLVVVVNCIVYFSLDMMRGELDAGLLRHEFVYFAISGVLLLLVYPLMYIVEKLFGFISDVTLVELADTNKGILRTLSENAPGTFQHSITVANLAAEVANKTGANSMLVRTGALYHDIGKLKNPVFFTENQSGVNPHDNLPYADSAKIITDHVVYGLTLADREGLPPFIKDFIRTHHGKGMAKYFYIKQMNEHPGEHVNVDDFTYIGPNPFTKEQAILMMTDSVEAASRSLQEYTETSIANLVTRIIDAQLNEGYFYDCPINFRDIAIAKQVLTERLKSIHHTRVVYPKMNK